MDLVYHKGELGYFVECFCECGKIHHDIFVALGFGPETYHQYTMRKVVKDVWSESILDQLRTPLGIFKDLK